MSDNHGSDRSLADHLSLTLALALAFALAPLTTCLGLETRASGIETPSTPQQATPTFDGQPKSWQPQHEQSVEGG